MSFEIVNFVMIKLCDFGYCEILNMNFKSRHSIFRKENIVLRLLGCALTRDSSRKKYPESPKIMGSYR